jgi:hypothetical protein
MQFTYQLTREDLHSFWLLSIGGTRRLLYWAAGWAAAFGLGTFVFLSLFGGHAVAALVTGLAVAVISGFWLFRRTVRELEGRLPRRDTAGVFDPHVLDLDANGVRSTCPCAKGEYSWQFVQQCSSWPSMTALHLNSGIAFVIPARAIADRAALVAFLKRQCQTVHVIGCPRCGYDTSKAVAERCSECGWSSHESA